MARAGTAGARRGRGGGSLRFTFLAVAAVIILPYAVLLAYFAYAQIAKERDRVQQAALVQARTLAAQVETLLTARVEALAATAEAVGSNIGNVGAIETQARRLRQSFADFGQILVVDQFGAAVASTAPLAEGRRPIVADQAWFKQAATSTEPFAGPPRQGAQAVVVSLYAPVRTTDGQFRGVVAADLTLGRVQETLARSPSVPGAAAEVIASQGLVVARHPPRLLLQDVQGLEGYPALLRGPEAVTVLRFEDGERRLTGAASIRPLGWTLVFGLLSAPALAGIRALVTQVGGSAAVAALLGLALALWLSRRTEAGMARLRAAMNRLETGDVPANVPVTVGGEIGTLTEGFNRTLAWLRGRLQEYEGVERGDETGGAAIPGEPSLDAVLPNLLRRIVGGIGADAGAIVIHEETGLVTRAAVGFGAVPTEGVTLRRGQGLAGAVVGTREPVLIEDVEADDRVEEPYLKEAGMRAVIGVPIVSRDRVIGAVEVGYRAAHAFTEAETQRLQAMAQRAAQALEPERGPGEVEPSGADLEARLVEQRDALRRAATEQAETQDARRQAQELELPIPMPVPRVREVVPGDPTTEDATRVRIALQKTVSDELQAPLAALLDLPRLLVDGLHKPLEPSERRQLEILHGRGEEIRELIDDLVLLSDIHAGQVTVTKAPVSLPELVHRVTRALASRAATKGNQIETDIRPSVGQVVTDGRRLEQVLANLLATSIKYTEVGEIRVTCSFREPDVVVTVADDGVGFSNEEQERIFEPFLQIGPRDGRALPGTGLRLTVAHRLVRLLGGQIRVESKVDRGTWFTVSLPAQS